MIPLSEIQELFDNVTRPLFGRGFNGVLREPARCRDYTGLPAEPGLLAIVIHDGGDLSAYTGDLGLRQKFVDALSTLGLSYKALETTDGTGVYSGVYRFCLYCPGNGRHKMSCTAGKSGYFDQDEPCLIPLEHFSRRELKHEGRLTLPAVYVTHKSQGPTWAMMDQPLMTIHTTLHPMPFVPGLHDPKEDPQPGDLKTWTDDSGDGGNGVTYTNKILSREGDVLHVESTNGSSTREGSWSLRDEWRSPGPMWIWRTGGAGTDTGITLDVTETGFHFRVSGDPADAVVPSDDALSGSRPSLGMAIDAAREWKRRLGGGS